MVSELLSINLLKELGLDKLPRHEQDALLQQMTETVANRLNLKLVSMLSEGDRDELEKVIESQGDLEGFYRKRIPNMDLIVAEIIAEFKKEMLDYGLAAQQAMRLKNS